MATRDSSTLAGQPHGLVKLDVPKSKTQDFERTTAFLCSWSLGMMPSQLHLQKLIPAFPNALTLQLPEVWLLAPLPHFTVLANVLSDSPAHCDPDPLHQRLLSSRFQLDPLSSLGFHDAFLPDSPLA